MTIIIYPVYNHEKWSENVTKTYFFIWESQKRVKCRYFVTVIFPWLMVERVTAYNTLYKTNFGFRKAEDDTKIFVFIL